jgi:hypothetical protein
MGRLPFALALLGLLFASTASGAPATEAVVSKPSLVCPQAKMGNEGLQDQYEKTWKQFIADVDLATRSLENEIAARFTEAQKAGHLDLALMWDGMRKQFTQMSEVRWDSAKEKKAWKQRFGEADFPDDLTALLKKCDQDYKTARERLEEGYRNIESALTKVGNLEQALKVRAELKAVLAGQSVPHQVPPSVSQTSPQPGNKRSLKERLAGKWIRTNAPDVFVFGNDGMGQILNTSSGKFWANGQLRFPAEDVAEVKWSNGFEWKMRLASDDYLAVVEKDSAGKIFGDGIVLIREVGARSGELSPRVVKLNQTTLGEFEMSEGVRIGDGGLLFDSPEKASFALTKQTYGYPLRVEFKATALPDRAYDIFPGLFCSRTDPEQTGVQLVWGHHWNKGSTLLLFGQRIGLRHIPIVPNKEHTIVLVVDRSRNLTVQCDGEQLWTGQLPKEAVLDGQIKLGGGVGKVVYKQVSISEK